MLLLLLPCWFVRSDWVLLHCACPPPTLPMHARTLATGGKGENRDNNDSGAPTEEAAAQQAATHEHQHPRGAAADDDDDGDDDGDDGACGSAAMPVAVQSLPAIRSIAAHRRRLRGFGVGTPGVAQQQRSEVSTGQPALACNAWPALACNAWPALACASCWT